MAVERNTEKDRNAYLEAWAATMIKIWEERIAILKIVDTRTLINSFASNLTRDAAGDIQKIEFTYEYYGKMVDMGVGNGYKLASGRKGKRKAREWYNKKFYSSFMRMADTLGQIYAEKAIKMVANAWDN